MWSIPHYPYRRWEGECPQQGDPFARDARAVGEPLDATPFRPERKHPRDHRVHDVSAGAPARAGGSSLFLPLLAFVALMLSAPASSTAQSVEIYTAAGAPPTVLLMWSPDSTTPGVRYNVYRRAADAAAWPAAPLNAAPLAPITNCATFQTIIPAGSATWTTLAAALADSTGGIPPIAPLADVCSITSFTPGSEEWETVQIFAGYVPAVARVMAQGYLDMTTASGTKYDYKIVKVNSSGSELPLSSTATATITSGTPGAIPVPGGVQAIPGDAMVQILWAQPTSRKFQAFIVERKPTAGGAWIRVSDVEYSALIRSTIHLDTLIPARNGFTDYQHYDDTTGALITHAVPNPPGVPVIVSGPFSGVAYQYRVRHKDPLGNPGGFSGVVGATPYDSTQPSVPQGLTVIANEEANGFDIRWNLVDLDIKGHAERVKGYRLYRYDQPEDPELGAIPVGAMIAHPNDTNETVSYLDVSGGLRSPCGDKTWYYRVEAIDSADNISYRSIAVGDALRDTTRPDNVKGTEAEGFDNYIKVRWDLNSDCDIDEYRIYRAYCNYGDWIPCFDTSYSRDDQKRFGQYLEEWQKQQKKDGKDVKDIKEMLESCGGPFMLVGTISHDEAEDRKAATGKAYYDDMTVPAGSPICYAYIVKAVDRSQNESGTMPLPDPTKEIIVCQRLRDKTPPGPAIISGLFARDSAVVVEWVGPPVQDIAAYHVYRAPKEDGPYTWTGGRTVVPPPGTGVNLIEPYKPPPIAGCDSIPLLSQSWMSAGRIIDDADPREIYWYKVVGVDVDGNETPHDSAVAIGTFTFKSNRDAPPSIGSITPVDDPCALEISWGPSFDADTAIGYAVFRCMSAGGDYYQVGSVIPGNSYSDNTVARNTTYWYRVALLYKDGSLSRLSAPVHGVHP